MTTPAFDPDHIAQHLETVRDYIRFAASAFEKANLTYGHGTANAVDEAFFMVLDTLDLPLDAPDPFLAARLMPDERRRVAAHILARITTRKPAPYILGRAYIQGYPFTVTEDVIVPRSYLGEILFSGGLVDLLPFGEDVSQITRILDLCTGSGCLAILAAQVFPDAQIDAVDLSPAALRIAEKNVDDYGLNNRIQLYEGDLFTPLGENKYDLILSNPPYVSTERVKNFPPEYAAEPVMAHAGGDDGISLVTRILNAAPRYLTPSGGLLCEVGQTRAAIEAVFPDLDLTWVDTTHAQSEVFWTRF